MNNPSSDIQNSDEQVNRPSHADAPNQANAMPAGAQGSENGKEYKAAESFLAEFLETLCSNSKSDAGILWLRHKKGVRWASSHGLKMSDADRDSPFTNDVVSNAEIVFDHGETDIFSCSESEGNLPGPVNDPVVRELVLRCRQLLLPLRKRGETFAVIALFQPTSLDPKQQWSLDDLGLVQKRLNTRLTSIGSTRKSPPQDSCKTQTPASPNSTTLRNTTQPTDDTSTQSEQATDQTPAQASGKTNSSLGVISSPPEPKDNTKQKHDSISVDESQHAADIDAKSERDPSRSAKNPDLAAEHQTQRISPETTEQVREDAAHRNVSTPHESNSTSLKRPTPPPRIADQTVSASKDPTRINPSRHRQDRSLNPANSTRPNHVPYGSERSSPELQSPEHTLKFQASSATPNQSNLARALNLSCVVGRNLDEEECAYTIANEVFGFFGHGRVSVAVYRGNRCRIRAISNQQVFDRRSSVVSSIERLTTLVATTKRSLFHPEQQTQLSSRILKDLERYYEAADTQSIAVLPLIQSPTPTSDPNNLSEVVRDEQSTKGDVVGAIAIEGLVRTLSRRDILSNWKLIERPITNALGNSREHNSLFLMPVWRELGRFTSLFRGHVRNKALGLSTLVLLTVLALTLIPGDLKVACEGVIQPAQQSKVFAETTGVVRELLVKDGERVEKGDVLIQLDDPSLLAEIASAEGEAREIEERLRTLKLQRMRDEFDSPEEKREAIIASSGFEAKLSKLYDQLDLLNQKRDQLLVKSPVAGRVVTWDTRRRLLSRPVEPGQSLLTVADASGPWELELRLPDKRSGYLRRAFSQTDNTDESPKASYVLASDPTSVSYGRLREVSRSTEVDEELGNVVRLYVDLDQPPNEDQRVRPGTEVLAQIHVGKASIGYCKLYEFFDWLNRTWFRWS